MGYTTIALTSKICISIYYKISSQVPIGHKEIRSTIRKICFVRFFTIQNSPRKRDSSSSNTSSVCGQDNNYVSQKSICRPSRSN